MPRMISALTGSLALLSCACAAVPAEPAGAMECGIVGSSDWAAWVNAMPGPAARPTLIVTGKVTVPSGATRVEWGDIRVMESYPLQVVAALRTTEPSGTAGAPVVVTRDVRGEWPIDPPVGALTLRCGDRVLARIAPVETAH